MGKRIAAINTCLYGSTGTIMCSVCDCAERQGYETRTFTAYARRKNRSVLPTARDTVIGGYPDLAAHWLLGRLTGRKGCFSILATLRCIRQLRRFQPDVIHLHNLHDSYINLPLLFRYLKRSNASVVWTLHDCWAFTGRCPHFDMLGCDRWQSGCHDCPYPKSSYPAVWRDRCAWLWKKKKAWFTGLENMTLVTPSRWLAEQAGRSFLREYPVRVIPNGIDLSVFKPTESDCRARLGIPEGKPLVLGVAFDWTERKGLDVFCALAERLGDACQIVLVGTDGATDKLLPQNILSVHRTKSRRELAELYTAADVFVNPTREEALGLVNLEALACGTPVLTFDTGGSPECIDESCGSVVAKNDIDALEREIRRIVRERPYTSEACLRRAARFERGERFAEYVALYDALSCRQCPADDKEMA